MESFFDSLKRRFKQKDLLIQLIIINVAVFVVLGIFGVVTKLFKLDTFDLLSYIGVSSSIPSLIKFWIPFTYMFVHQEFWHIFFNMLLLYWFGQIFLQYFNAKILGSLYVLGGLAGAVLYILAFNTIPYYIDMPHMPLIGASASVMAVIFGVAFFKPNATMRLLLLGEVKIVYIAIFFFAIDFFKGSVGANAGGSVAHIGGAAIGYLFAVQYGKGKDITRWMTRIMDFFANLSKPKPKMKVKYKKRDEAYTYNERKNNEQETIDNILDKIKASGYASLSKDEKQKLFEASKK